ncbi:MAG TPA: hypothetical protein VFU59_00865, partial [Candidatus Eisenbacteria bacterium]|nr:hypothetical protein [Candidatus Eisenbacteria bacterium]
MTTTLHSTQRTARPWPRRSRRALARLLACLHAGAALLAAGLAHAAGPGSGSAALSPLTAVTAGSSGSWVVTYRAEEGFPHATGGAVDIEIPAGWTPPTLTVGQPGQVTVSSPHVSSVTILPPRTIRLFVGEAPAQKFNIGDSVVVVYGGAGGAAATASSTAPATANFRVYTDPNVGDGITTGEVSGGPLALSVLPGPLASVRIEDATGAAVGAFTRSADADTTQLFLRGYDSFGNSLGPVAGAWNVVGGIGSVTPVSGTNVTLTLTTTGVGRVSADAGGFTDTTGNITVTSGAYAALEFGAASSTTAGGALAVSSSAVDADGNVVSSGPGAGAAIRFVAYAAATGPATADPDFVDDTATLAAGAFTGAVTPRRAGDYWIAARDDGSGFESPRLFVSVAADAPHHLALVPDTLALVAGVAATLTVESRDLYENLSPVSADEALALWTNRPAGTFQDLGGGAIFEVTIPNGASSAQFRFRDTQSVASGGRVRAIDTGFAPPHLGTGEATVTTAAAAPAGSVALTAAPDTLEADGAAVAAVVSGVMRDAFGNAVPAGVAVTATGTLVAPSGDADGGTAGVQWLTDAAGVVSGTVVAGTVKGSGGVSIASIAGAATGAAPIVLLAGVPAGAIALAAAPPSILANGSATTTVGASGLVDANGNPVENGERYTVATDLGSIVASDADAGTPGIQIAASSGAIAFTLQSGTTLGTANVTATSVRGAAAGSTTVSLLPGPVDGATSSVAATSPAPVGPVGSVLTITLRDAQNHPRSGVASDSIAVVVSGLAAAVAPLSASTDANGAIDFRVTATLADTAVVAASAFGTPIAASATIVFTAGAVDHYTIAGPTPPLLAGRADTLRVTARDAFENPAPAADASRLSVRVTGGVATVPDTVSFGGALATVPFTPIAASPLTILIREVVPPLRNATFGPAAVEPAGPYAVDSVAVASPTLATGDSTAVEVWIDDAYGNRRPGAAVAASLLAGAGSVAPAVAVTDAAGRALFRIHAGPAPGAVAVRFLASASPAPDAVRADTATVAVTAGAAASIEIANATGGIVAGGLLNITLTLRDAFGNVATGATPTVRLRTSTPQPSLDNIRWSLTAGASGALADSAASDGALYQFAAGDSGTAVVAARDTLAETIVFRVSGTGLPLAETAPVAILPAPPTLIAVVSGDAQTGVVADTLALPLRVRTRDSFGNPTPGAVVRFTVTAGGGAIDAVLGGGADSDAIADGSGVARADVWRLGTLAGAANSARAALVATPSSFVGFSATAIADTASLLTLAPASLALAPTQTATVTAVARDAYGNAVAGELLTLFLAGPSFGSLQPLAGATSGGPGSQSGLTDALGRVAVRYAAPSTAPAVDSIYVRSARLAAIGIRAATSVGATTSLRVTADSLGWIAGAPVRVRVVPLDAQGNTVVGDGANAVMRAVAGVSFSPSSGSMAAGFFETFATATTAGTIASIGADRAGTPGVGGSTGPVAVRPSSPAGTIPVSASRTTLTADGRSLATVTIGPVLDIYGNVVAAGSALAASVTSGSLASGSVATDA